jgi:hypothetical protein
VNYKKYFFCSEIIFIVNLYINWNEILKKVLNLITRVNDYGIENKHNLTK